MSDLEVLKDFDIFLVEICVIGVIERALSALFQRIFTFEESLTLIKTEFGVFSLSFVF